MFKSSNHAGERYKERFEGNITIKVARERVEKIGRQARFRRIGKGGVRIYSTRGMDLVVANNMILTIYRRSDTGFIEA